MSLSASDRYEDVWWGAGQRTLRVMARTELWGRRIIEAIDMAAGAVLRLDEGEVAPLASRRWGVDEVVWRAAAMSRDRVSSRRCRRCLGVLGR